MDLRWLSSWCLAHEQQLDMFDVHRRCGGKPSLTLKTIRKSQVLLAHSGGRARGKGCRGEAGGAFLIGMKIESMSRGPLGMAGSAQTRGSSTSYRRHQRLPNLVSEGGPGLILPLPGPASPTPGRKSY